jgi:hypothetical protein
VTNDEIAAAREWVRLLRHDALSAPSAECESGAIADTIEALCAEVERLELVLIAIAEGGMCETDRSIAKQVLRGEP